MNERTAPCFSAGVRKRWGWLFILMVAGFVFLLPAGDAAWSVASGDEPTADEVVDENLFLMRWLDALYGEWHFVVPGFSRMERLAQAELRRSALRAKHHIELSESLDPLLAQLYGEFVASLNEHRDIFITITGADEEEDELRNRHWRRAVGRGAADGITSTVVTGKPAASLSGVFTGVLEVLEGPDTAELRQRVTRIVHQAERNLEDRTARFQSTGDALARRYGWGQHEPYISLREGAALLHCMERDDLECAISAIRTMRERRPRDLWLHLMHAQLTSLLPEVDVQGMLAQADECLKAIELIPPAALYDEHRMVATEMAASIAGAAREYEIHLGKAPLGETKAGRKAVELSRRLLEYDPADATGESRAWLAEQLVANNELDEARRLIVEVADVQEYDPCFVFLAARLMSRIGEYDTAIDLLKDAIAMGIWDTPWIREHPDFMSLRGARSEQFLEVLRVRTTWSIHYGFLNDDITLTNNSTFPITDVVFKLKLQQDERDWDLQLTADEILPGATHRWRNVVSIPGNRLTDSSARLECYENRR